MEISTANLLCGSIGFVAPEYGFESNSSTKGDVYSFDIAFLEMVTKKRPTYDMFVGGQNLHRWVKSCYRDKMEQVIDSSLVRSLRDRSPEIKKTWDVAIAELIELGILCTQESPSTRPSMLDAADDLDRLKRYLAGDTTATFASSLGISSSTIGDG
ncbi:Leucine-rich receptor-like protein kinase family protein [Euphorbia peplus]|nr:Leucine-rich receptor-like protein kinase family protein [Euphorbia peplus]